MPPARRAVTAAGLALALGAAAGCARGTVRVAYRPAALSTTSYEVTVRTTSTLQVDGEQPVHKSSVVTLRADQAVLEAGPDGNRVEVTLRVGREAPETVIVRLDRDAQLVGIEPVPGTPRSSAVDDLGVAELFPAAASAPPDRPLRPGDHWTLDVPLTLPDATPTRLTGDGTLDRLSVREGRRLATVTSHLDLPVVRRTTSALGRETVLEGDQRSVVLTTHDLLDGSVVEASATTTAHYGLRLLAPASVGGPPKLGTLDLVVRSTTSRIVPTT